MEVLGIITTAANCLCTPDVRGSLASTWQHLKHPRKRLENLVKETKELTEQAQELRQELEEIRIRHGREGNPTVNTWLSKVTSIDNQVMETLVPRVGEDKKCLCGLLPNYRSRLMIGKQIMNKSLEVLELRKGGQSKDIAQISRLPPAKGQILPVPDKLTVVGTTRTKIDQIWSYLMDNKVGRIGVHGMGGIGKTTLMKEVNNKLMESNTGFDCVHWVSASKDFNLDQLQKAIAAAIGLKLTDEDEDHVRRAAKLLDALMWKKRVVLILDNMWQAFSLEDIGIPKPTRVNGFKVIITTRDLTVCRGMETDHDVEIKVLTEDEAWRIFNGLVGMDMSRVPTTTQTIMKDVANECGGLPLAICTVAKALRRVNNNIQWQNALAALRSPDGNILNMDEKVFGALRFSYENIRDKTTRSCFLYCALFPEAHLIQTEELIEYWMWEGLFGDSEMIKDYMQRGETVLREIADASLLESTCDQDGRVTYVKMHDMVRDMARRISPQWVIEAGVGLIKPPYEGKWTKDVERISLMRNDLRELPSKPMCPLLSSLLLQYNSLTENISHSFFNHLVYLKVIDLSFTGISFLPLSLSMLVNLRALLLRHCWNLSLLPSLAKLLELRVLDLSFTLITELPRGIEMLTNLRRLNLSHTRLKMLSAGLFSKVPRLEHLLTEGSGLVWGSSLISDFKGSVVEELRGAINLRMLNATFMDMQVFNMYLTFADDLQLESFQLCIGQQHDGCEISPSEEKSIIISGCELAQNSIMLPAYTTELCIAVCFSEQQRPLFIDNASYLKKCRINYCRDVPCIIMNEDNYLSSLETMELKYLDGLMELFPENPRRGALESLEILHIANCNNMKILLSSGWVQHLRNLKEIYVEDCESMEQIISSGVEDCEEIIPGVELSNAVTLPNLKKLHLSKLTNLKSIFDGVLVCNALRSIEVSGCLKLKRLPRFVPAPWALKEIKAEREWWNNLNWDHAPHGVKSLFQPMFIEDEQAESSYQHD